MSEATKAKSAKARATIACRKLKTVKPWPLGNGLGRSFDDCFEMYDGDEVFRILAFRAVEDDELYQAIQRHGFTDWAQKIDNIKATLVA